MAGSTQTVTWDVAGTDAAPVSATNLKISLSTDGGHTYPEVLADRTPNDGTEPVVMPNVGTEEARIKVEAVGNVFFDVSNEDFTIQALPDTGQGDSVEGNGGLPVSAGSAGTYAPTAGSAVSFDFTVTGGNPPPDEPRVMPG